MDLLGLFDREENTEDFSAGQIVFEEGTPGDKMYVVLQGKVSLAVRGRSIATIGPGELVGEMALVDSRARSATAEAETDCRLAVVDQKRFLFLVQSAPTFAIHVMRVMTERLRRMTASV